MTTKQIYESGLFGPRGATVAVDNHTAAYNRVKDVVDLWWNGNITRLELMAQIAMILVNHECLEGGN